MGDQLVDLLEGARIEQQVDPLAGGELARLVLPARAFFSAAEFGAALEVGEDAVSGPSCLLLESDRRLRFTCRSGRPSPSP